MDYLNVLKWVGPAIGVVAVGSLVYLYAFGQVEVPMQAEPTPSDVGFCAFAPDWAQDEKNLELVEQAFKGLGININWVDPVECSDSCTMKVDEVSSTFPCVKGMTVVDLRQGHDLTEDHAGRCNRLLEGGDWGVVQLPAQLPDLEEGQRYRRDAEALVLAHELMHCVGGYDHARTPAGCGKAHPSGHLMHPQVALLGGWDTTGM